VVLIALLLRIWGISADLPYIYHPDEPVTVVISLRMFRTGDMNPHFFHWPSLLFYLNVLAYAPYYLLAKLLGAFQTPDNILAPMQVAMGSVYAPVPTAVLLSRLLSVGFGIGSVLVAYMIGKRMTARTWVGLLAALLVAISPTAVQHSRWTTPDTMAAFFVLASVYASLLVYQEGKTRYYIVAAICIGLAASSKYNAVLAIFPLLVAHFLRHGRRSLKERDLYFSILLSALVFLLTSPFALLDFREFYSALMFDSQHYATGHAGMEGDAVQWYLHYLWSTSGPILLLALLGLGWGIASRSRDIAILSSFPIVYLLFISRFAVRNERTLLPALAFLFILAVVAVTQLAGWVAHSRSQAVRYGSKAALTALMIVPIVLMLALTVQDALRLNTVDSRETARIWIAENLPAGANVAVESYAPFVQPERFHVQGFSEMIDHTPDWYVEQGFEYLVFGQGMYGRFYAEPEKYAAEIAQYDSFFGRFELVRLFTDGDYEVRVYRVTPEQAVPSALDRKAALGRPRTANGSVYTYSSR
jgi:4-amino-4-deoxy-L-arabinose transferase-like glycosyltransferase